jgi:peptide/nickel transport system substrate-binding protein
VFSPLEKAAAERHATSDDPWAFDWFMTNSTPSGPYVISEYRPGERVVLEPNPHYHDAKAVGASPIVVLSVPGAEERGLLLQRGELDLATGLAPAQLKKLEQDPGVTVHAVDSSRTNYLGMNTTMPPLDKVDVRRAISYAIPYQALIENVMHGYATRAGNLLTPANETYAGDEVGSYDTDLGRARDLLDRAGVDGFELELAVRQSRAEDRQAATFIQENLRQIGIDVSISVLPDGEFAERLNAKELPLFINDFIGWGEDPFYKMNFLAHTGEFTNFTQYSNPRLDELIDQGIFEADPARRAEISREAQQILLDDAPMAYLYAPQWVVATRSDVAGAGKDLTEVVRLDRLSRIDR